MFFKKQDHRETEEFKNCRLAVLSVFKEAFSRIEQEQFSITSKSIEYVSASERSTLQKVVECDKSMKELYQEYENIFDSTKKFEYSEKERYFERSINSTLHMLTKEDIKKVSHSGTTTITATKPYKAKTSEELYKEYINS